MEERGGAGDSRCEGEKNFAAETCKVPNWQTFFPPQIITSSKRSPASAFCLGNMQLNNGLEFVLLGKTHEYLVTVKYFVFRLIGMTERPK